MDLIQLNTKQAAEDGATVYLRNPFTGERLEGMEIDVFGQDSAAFRNYARARANRRLKRRNDTTTVEQLEDENVELLVSCTKGWRNITLDGKELEFSKDNARKLYRDERFPWLKEQVDEVIGERSRFLRD